MSRFEVFLMTFIAYISVHSLRTSYSYNKPYLIEELKTDSRYFGLVDAGMMLALGSGHLYHALNRPKSNVRAVWGSSLICGILLGSIPLLIYYLPGIAKIGILVLMLMQGFSQSYQWPNLLVIVQSKYSAKSDSKMLSFWATSGSFGNIFGLLACHLLSLVSDWYFGIIFAASFSFIIGIIFCLTMQDVQKDQYDQIQNVQNNHEDTTLQPNLSILCTDSTVTCIMLIFGLLKSIMYSLLFWLPLYFYSIGLKQYFALIPICYDVVCIFGSMILGSIFVKYPSKSKMLAPIILMLLLCFASLRWIKMTVLGYCLVIGLIGGLLGGIFNLMSVLIVLSLTDSMPVLVQHKYVGFYSDLIMAVGNLMTALTQIIIGFVVKQDSFGVFMICGIYLTMALVCSIFLYHIQERNIEKE